MKVVISTSGRVEHIGSGLFEGGVTHRASHVEPESWLYRLWFHIVRYWSPNESAIAEWTRGWRTRWRANLGPSNGPILGPFVRRNEAIAAEVAWREKNYLGRL